MNFNLLQSQTETPSVLFVCALGIGVVFIGLVFLVLIVSLMNFFTQGLNKKTVEKKTSEKSNVPSVAGTVNDAPIENRQEILAAVCAAIAEENGTDISAIRVLSFKKVQ